MTDGPSRLSISCSSPAGLARVRRAAEVVLGAMPGEMARDLCSKVIVFCVDHRAHAAYCQGFPDSGAAQLGQERVRRGQTGGDLVVVVLCLTETTPVARILAHELGHVHLGHTDTSAVAALSADEKEGREREAEEFAARYTS
jgi:IrrE N-terminal-like domain